MQYVIDQLSGQALDVATALALGYVVDGTEDDYGYIRWRTPQNTVLCHPFSPSGDGGFCFFLMEKDSIRWNKDGNSFYAWMGGHSYVDPLHEPMLKGFAPIMWDAFSYGQTLKEAVLRCFASSRLGEVVHIPDDLLPEDVVAQYRREMKKRTQKRPGSFID